MISARKFWANYSILAAGDLFGRLLAFWATVHITGVLGKSLFGTLSFAMAFTAYFEMISRQGLDYYSIQALARKPSEAHGFAGTLLGLRMITSLTAFLILIAVVSHLAKPHELKLLIL